MKIFITLDDKSTITGYGIPMNKNHMPIQNGIEVDTEIDLENLCMNYKYINDELVELTVEEKEFYISQPQPTLEEKVQLQEDKINILTEENKKQDEVIDVALLATDEIFMMLEPLLVSQVSTLNTNVNKITEMYVLMVQRGLKTIDEVPITLREEVKNAIKNK